MKTRKILILKGSGQASSQEVTGSIPLSSTNRINDLAKSTKTQAIKNENTGYIVGFSETEASLFGQDSIHRRLEINLNEHHRSDGVCSKQIWNINLGFHKVLARICEAIDWQIDKTGS